VTLTFKGRVNVDIRDSAEGWTPLAPLKAAEEAPDVVYIVLNDVGFPPMSS
jgi:arylsulfatase